jgi:hypothetical protein
MMLTKTISTGKLSAPDKCSGVPPSANRLARFRPEHRQIVLSALMPANGSFSPLTRSFSITTFIFINIAESSKGVLNASFRESSSGDCRLWPGQPESYRVHAPFLADLAMRGWAISFVMRASVALLDSFLGFLVLPIFTF